MHPNNADGMANSVDPDQTAPLGTVWYGSTLFAQTYLSENLGSLWYTVCLDLSVRKFANITVTEILDRDVKLPNRPPIQ